MRRLSRRAAEDPGPDAPDDGPVATVASTAGTDTASRLHAFNRFEIKYLVPQTQADGLRTELGRHMDEDAYSGATGYPITSLYYDTAHLRFYWEKIEGLRFRRKLRVRHYGTADDLTADSPVFVEIKQRVNRVTQKRRVCLPYRDALRLCSPQGLAESKRITTLPILAEFDRYADTLAAQSARLFGSEEAIEGMTAFLQKRPPAWAAVG